MTLGQQRRSPILIQQSARVKFTEAVVGWIATKRDVVAVNNSEKENLLWRIEQPFYRLDKEDDDDGWYDSQYMREKRLVYPCLALIISPPAVYHRVSIAEIWDLEWFDDNALKLSYCSDDTSLRLLLNADIDRVLFSI